MAKKAEYTASSIKTFKGLDHVRHRPAMYLGTDARNVAFREIVDNAFDEISRGYAHSVRIIIHKDNDYEVIDDGRGVPFDWDEEEKVNGIVKSLGKKDSGSNFDDSIESGALSTSGTNGIGASACNAISEAFSVTVRRDNKTYTQEFQKGKAGRFTGSPFDNDSSFKEDEHMKLKGVKDTSGLPTGTSIRWSFDPTIMPDDRLDLEEVLMRARLITYLTPGAELHISYPDDREPEHIVAPDVNGTAECLNYLSKNKADFTLSGEGEFTSYSGARSFTWEISVNHSDKPHYWGFANGVYNAEGGSHVTGSNRAISNILSEKFSKVKGMDLKKGEEEPTPDDFSDIISYAVSVRGPGIPLEGQAKVKVSSPSMARAINETISTEMKKWAENKNNIGIITELCRAARDHARERRSLEITKKRLQSQRSQKRLGENLSLPDTYLPSKLTGRGSGSELYITEGLSARGTVKKARDANIHAVFPIRGKILNTYNLSITKSLKNAEISAITQILNCGIGKSCNPDECRFDKIFFAADADPDGMHIGTLLALLFYTMFRPLMDEGMVYATHPPLFAIKSGDDVHYAVDEEARDEIVAKLKKENKKFDISRNKGLGEMDEESFADTVLSKENRVITQIKPDDIEDNMDDILQLLFGKDTEARREWLRIQREFISEEDIRE